MTSMSDISVLITLPFPDERIKRLEAISPRLRFHVLPARTAAELPQDLLPDIEILYTLRALPEPESVPNLVWIQLHFAGVDHVVDHALLREDVKVTTLSGAAAPQMAEFAVMSMLALGHRLSTMLDDPPEKRWADDRFKRYRPTELRGSTVGIIGYGSIGREIARISHAMGARLLVSKHDLKNLEDRDYMKSGLGDPNGILPERIYPSQALPSLVSECDFIVITVPLTSKTRGLICEKVFDAMKPAAYLIDVSRGGIVDHGALVSALNEGKLAGAALDVYPVEPLPEGSPLWEMPNVILSPHVAGASVRYYARAVELFAENLERYLAGRPLLNVYNPSRGY
jgi:phosphoglycerate dehydrogenase-like enzyme